MTRSCWNPALNTVVAILSLAMMAACADQHPIPDDPKEAHPLHVSQETILLNLPAPLASGDLREPYGSAVRKFSLAFLDRGRGLVIVEIVGPSDSSDAWLYEARKILLGQGLRPNQIGMLSGVTPSHLPAKIRLSFKANKVHVPNCGNWISATSGRFDNTSHSNYGCAYQRNLGLMVQNPGDLIHARPVTSPDPDRTVTVIRAYRAYIGGVEEGE